ncbi:MAG TPA: type II toxin-antitoxin system VapC family toxin [Actinomycetales bacterium]|nr:type II toxin-antitoxin system VapC family toxin [Actinomycetales bacterium]
MIYLDSSALLKLVVDEPESTALRAWLSDRPDAPRISSQIAKIEVVRACRRGHASALPAARTLLSGLDLIPLTSGVVDAAMDVGQPALRSLDAIHLASALPVREDLTAFVAYDLRLADAAAAVALDVVRPGAQPTAE